MNLFKKIAVLICLLYAFSPSIGVGEWVVIPPKMVALTFDDGPRPVTTEKFLSTLKRNQAKATFFVVGKMAEKYPMCIQEMLKDGHEVASHTWSHRSIKTLSKSSMILELSKTQVLLEKLTGQRTWLFRPPGGSLTDWRNKNVTPAGYTMILWNVHGHDQEGLSAQKIAQNVLTQTKENDIILLHNGLENTVEALNIIIPELKKRGFVFVSVSELIRRKNQKQLAVAVYPKKTAIQ